MAVTMQQLKSYKAEIPSILIPRQSGRKLEQFVRAFVFEPYDYFKVMTMAETSNIEEVLYDLVNGYKPNKFDFDLKGATNSARILNEMYDGCK
jgi:predicted glycosyltransferase